MGVSHALQAFAHRVGSYKDKNSHMVDKTMGHSNFSGPDQKSVYFAGAGGTLLSGLATGALPGICAAGLVFTGAGAVTAGPSSTLPEEVGASLPK